MGSCLALWATALKRLMQLAKCRQPTCAMRGFVVIMALYREFGTKVMVRRASTFKMRDVTRALKGAEHAGVAASVDILRDGTIRLTPMAAGAPAPETNEWDRVLGKPAVRS
jgi:hypothetical protein